MGKEETTLKILVDADGCPVVPQTIETAQALQLPVWLLADTAHSRYQQQDGVEGAGFCLQTMVVGKGADAVDFALLSKLQKNDIVVTQDYGLAAMVLAQGGHAINQNGLVYTQGNIDQLLFQRHVSKKIRSAGGRVKGPAKRQASADEAFSKQLRRLCEEVLACDTCNQ